MNKSGFIEGTLVHTDKGLIPIEQLKVGDMVLSKANDKANVEFKAITNVVTYISQPVLALHIVGKDIQEMIFTSINGSYWVYNLNQKRDKVDRNHGNWIDIESINPFSPIAMLKLEVGMLASVKYLYKSLDLKTAFYPAFAEYGFPTGYSINLDDYKTNNIFVPPEWEYEDACQSEEIGTEIPFDDVVYSLEIEDYHTYFVGTEGLWVHE